jgi:hypothetical protein
MAGDTALGFAFLQAPDLIRQIDALAAELAERMGHPEFSAWQVLADYSQRALGVTLEESGIGSKAAALAHLAANGETPERVAEIAAEWDRQGAEAEAYAASPEGQELAAALQPDNGPEGWSTVPPGAGAS